MGLETKITVSDTPGFEKDAYIRISGGPWYKTWLRIVNVDSPTQVTIRWEWWREYWFQFSVIYWLWAGWNTSI
jgi:hypothetical protein